MPLFYQHNINEQTKLGIWKIAETEAFFSARVPLQREITHPHKKLQHLAGRYLLTQLFEDFPYEEIVIADTRKPYLPYEQYHFSISHCGDYAAAIVSSGNRVGIDIELVTEKINRIKHKFLNEEEMKMLLPSGNNAQIANPDSGTGDPKSENQHQMIRQLTVLWSAKEAIFKWWGWGSIDFSEHILLQHFELSEEGKIPANFIRTNENYNLTTNYKTFENLCLVWVVS